VTKSTRSFDAKVKSLPAYAKAQGAAGSGVAPPVDEMNQLLMGLVVAAQRSFHLLADRIEDLGGLKGAGSRRGEATHCHGVRKNGQPPFSHTVATTPMPAASSAERDTTPLLAASAGNRLGRRHGQARRDESGEVTNLTTIQLLALPPVRLDERRPGEFGAFTGNSLCQGFGRVRREAQPLL